MDSVVTMIDLQFHFVESRYLKPRANAVKYMPIKVLGKSIAAALNFVVSTEPNVR